ncbi:MAG: fatty acid desaturase [Candidatus Kapabacteria bacterium]|nr:fatty acid desaturase [Candidatus Kapabacteria bacterium]
MGVAIASFVIAAWAVHLWWILEYARPVFSTLGDSLTVLLHIAVQGYLFTGLFITAHDAMHGTVSPVKRVNTVIGTIASLLFAGISYSRLRHNHFKHHAHPGTSADPDFSLSQNYIMWFFTFMKHYTTLSQIIIMAVLYNILKLRYEELSLWMFWIIPSFIGALQLFTFGTYLPHRLPHNDGMQPHNARSMQLNHLLAMLSCYFFGYHHEHHESPRTPWWQLYKRKEESHAANLRHHH